jgi:hypothetical protein
MTAHVSRVMGQPNNVFIAFGLQGPSIRLADFGCAGRMATEGKLVGLARARGTTSELDVPEVAAAMLGPLGGPVVDPHPRCLGAPHDVWSLAQRVFPSLLPLEACCVGDPTWKACAVPLLEACGGSLPALRPTTHALSTFFAAVARGQPAATALSACGAGVAPCTV